MAAIYVNALRRYMGDYIIKVLTRLVLVGLMNFFPCRQSCCHFTLWTHVCLMTVPTAPLLLLLLPLLFLLLLLLSVTTNEPKRPPTNWLSALK